MDPTHRQTSFRYRTIVLIFTVFSTLLIFLCWYATGIAPRLMHMNYLSIQYAAQMDSALISIYLAESSGSSPPSAEMQRFESNLTLEKQNITEPGETEIVDSIEDSWRIFKGNKISPSVSEYQSVSGHIKELIAINEKGMAQAVEHAKDLRLTVLTGGAIGLILCLLYAAILPGRSFKAPTPGSINKQVIN